MTDFDINSSNPEDSGPGSEPKQDSVSFGAEDFFSNLEKGLESSLFDEPSEQVKAGEKQEAGVDDKYTELEKELDTLKNRYASSSKEAKRLAEENKRLAELEQYKPILEAMKEDPQLVENVANYLDNKGQGQSLADEMALPEDFEFNLNEAIRDPGSDSAKVLDHLIESRVTSKVSAHDEERSKKELIRAQQEELKRKYKLEDEDIHGLVEWANTRKLSLEDLYFLKNRDSRDKNISRNAVNDAIQQSRNNSRNVKSLAGSGSGTETPASPEDLLFDAIKNKTEGDLFL